MAEHAYTETLDVSREGAARRLTQTTEAIYFQAPVSNATVVVIAVFFFFILRGRIDPTLLGAWSALMIATAVLRLSLWQGYRKRAKPTAASQQFWLNSYTLACVLVGISWGSIQFFMGDFSDRVVVVALLMLVLGVCSSAVAILSYHLPAFFGYCAPQIAMLVTVMMLPDVPGLKVLSSSLLIYLVMLTLFARNAHRQFRESSELITRNEGLVDRLNHENEQREEVIRQRTRKLEETNDLLQEQIAVREQAEAALRQQKASLQSMAEHDSLTGLPNRLLFTDRLSQAIVRAQRHPVMTALFFIDLDHFKQINDSLGHSTGDELLKAVAARLLERVRQEDTVARLGGDEFILLAEGIEDAAAIRRMAGQVLSCFSKPFSIDDNSFVIGASIGISVYPNDGDNPETLLRNADSAMYRAKADGRGAFRFYTSELTELAQQRLSLESELHNALQSGQLQLYYQPQVRLSDERIVGVEALVRWNHPELGLVLPDRFIPVAEESSLINRVGEWVLGEGCRQLGEWQKAGLTDLTLAINLSGREFWNNPLIEELDRVLAETGCVADRLELEITESYLLQSPKRSYQLIQAIRDRGISVALDDFGTGYSSLGYLKNYDVNRLKVDQSFVRDIPTDTDDQAIVRAIIAMGHSLGLQVVAEGVETEKQAAFLLAEGCEYAQGYLFARPMPADDCFSLLMERSQPEASPA